MARVRNFSTMTAAAVALVTVGIVASGCSPTKEAASTATASGSEISARRSKPLFMHLALALTVVAAVVGYVWL
mgnify:CR=1 FL=1